MIDLTYLREQFAYLLELLRWGLCLRSTV